MARSVVCKVAILMFTLGATLGQAGTLELHAGDVVLGTLDRVDGATLFWNADAFGELELPMTLVARIDTDADADAQSALASRCEVAEEEGRLVVECQQTTDDEFAEEDLVIAAADAPLQFNGYVDTSFESDEDNSDSTEFELDLRFELESLRYRHSFRLEHESETSLELTTDESYEFDYQLDRFLTSGTSRWFAYARASWNKDRFRNPESLSAGGIGIGYDWDASAALNLRMQSGVDRWQFSTDDNTDTRNGFRVEFLAEYTFERLRQITFFHENEVVRQIGGDGAYVVLTETGFRWPISQGFHAQISFDVDRAQVPQELTDLVDENREWTFGISYRW